MPSQLTTLRHQYASRQQQISAISSSKISRCLFRQRPDEIIPIGKYPYWMEFTLFFRQYKSMHLKYSSQVHVAVLWYKLGMNGHCYFNPNVNIFVVMLLSWFNNVMIDKIWNDHMLSANVLQRSWHVDVKTWNCFGITGLLYKWESVSRFLKCLHNLGILVNCIMMRHDQM